MATREQIYSALFALVSNAAGFTTKSRRLRHWDDVEPSAMPAIFQLQKGESFIQTGRGLPPKTVLRVELYVYAYQPDNHATPSTQLNNLLDAIVAALKPDVDGYQTLGGIVSHCWIEGEIETDEGVLGQKGAMIIPINILTNY